MSFGDGDFNPSPVNYPDLVFTPGSETGRRWFTAYSSQAVGAAGMVGIPEFQSNFITRDIGGKTAGICVNPWDFNFVKAYTVENGGSVVARPENYTRDSFTPCDCSYHKCNRTFNGLGYTFDVPALFRERLNDAFGVLGETGSANGPAQWQRLGFPVESVYNQVVTGTVTPEEFNSYKSQIAGLDQVVLGSQESVFANYVFSKICGSVTAGIQAKNNLLSILAFSGEEIVITGQDWGDVESGEADWTAVANDIVRNYAAYANIPGFEAVFLYEDGIEEKCMCIDAGMHGLDAYPKADYEIVLDQLTSESGAGGWDAVNLLGFDGPTSDLGEFFTIDSDFLKKKGVTGVMPYRYGPNWAYGFGYSDQNVLAVGIPEYKNWEARNSSKIRMSGVPNGEPYSFGNQWLDWSGRIGSPEIEYVAVSPITYGGGDFVDANFGYRGKLEGSLIYKGRLPSDVLVYEGEGYTFAFLGMSSGTIPSGGFAGAQLSLLALTSIRLTDAVTNEEAYGNVGSIEDIVFSSSFYESNIDKSIYTQ